MPFSKPWKPEIPRLFSIYFTIFIRFFLRIDDFSIEVKLTVQQFSDQEKNRLRWWNKYDLPRFKEVPLKEAAARPEGLPLETALLQRCRDYFEDYADEVLDKVGISDVDRYLETLKHKIDNPYQK